MVLGFTCDNKANHIKAQINHKPKSRHPEKQKKRKRAFYDKPVCPRLVLKAI